LDHRSSLRRTLLGNILEVIWRIFASVRDHSHVTSIVRDYASPWRDLADLRPMNETSTLGIKEEHAEINVSVHLDTEFFPLPQKTNKFV